MTKPERGPFDWLGPMPSSPANDPYQDDNRAIVPQDSAMEDWKRISPINAAYVSAITRAVEMDWMKMIDRSWFIAEWHGAPRWKWIVRVYVALLLTGPALALFGWVVLGWYR